MARRIVKVGSAGAIMVADEAFALDVPPSSSVVMVPETGTFLGGIAPEIEVELWSNATVNLTNAEFFIGALHPVKALTVADKVFTAEADDEKMTAAAHGLLTGDGPFRVSNSGGALPAGLTAGTDYWIEKFDANVFYLCTSKALAAAGTHVSITTDGTGTQTLSDTADTERAFTAANGTEIFTAVAHGLLTGDGPLRVENTGGALPAGLASDTDYYAILITADTFYLATSRANALFGTHLAITTNGTGVNTISDVDASAATAERVHWHSDGLLGVAGDGAIGLTSQLGYMVTRSNSSRAIAYAIAADMSASDPEWVSCAVYPRVNV
jgi:hypothetical protein